MITNCPDIVCVTTRERRVRFRVNCLYAGVLWRRGDQAWFAEDDAIGLICDGLAETPQPFWARAWRALRERRPRRQPAVPVPTPQASPKKTSAEILSAIRARQHARRTFSTGKA